jgi:oxygen-independent coproporphyrinogen-3 oxidase
LLLANGYADIGMDHFALPGEALLKARDEGRLHRSFMGYTTQYSGMLVGLGVSSISDAGIAFAQNEKTLHDYYNRINQDELPIKKGYILSAEDIVFRKHILNLSCKGQTTFSNMELELLEQYSMPLINQLQQDGLIDFTSSSITITTEGRYFIRNICSVFDLHMHRNQPRFGKPMYSKAM